VDSSNDIVILVVIQHILCLERCEYSFLLSATLHITQHLVIMSSYFSLPSFARAKQNQENLEKTNPQNPVLKDGDEHFLNQQIESDKSAPEGKDAPATMITEEGEEKEVPQESQEQTAAGADQVVVPEEKPVPAGGAQDSKGDTAQDGSVEDPPEQAPEDSTEKVEASATKEKKNKKNKSFDLPSQEDAEAATRGFNVGAAETGEKANERTQGEKRTWASYLPSMSSGAKKEQTGEEKPADEHTKADPKDQSTTQGPNPESEEATKGESKGGDGEESAEKRTWVQYASSAYSSLPSMPSLPTRKSKDTDSKAEPVYNEDGTINEEETKKKQEQEVSVLLDNLNMSSINNRVFAFSGETQKIYERFAQVLKDTMEGGPTAYEDMDKLMKDAGPQLEKQFQAMPPFVQTLVKSLPSKLGTTLGPELLAAASEKPGNDMKARMQAANKTSASASGGTGDASIKTAETGGEEAQKKKRRIPGLKGLVSQQGTVASILRNVVTFLRVRFPFLASTTNVVMSLAVFSKFLIG